MGTGRARRYLNTVGSQTSASEYAIVHSNEGTFIRSGKRHDRVRLGSGCHGQNGMDLLDKYHIEYTVTHTYANGVRIGNVPNHKKRDKQAGGNQSWFPKNWTFTTIKRACEYVVKLKRNANPKDGVPIFGRYKGVRVGVIMTNGKIGTIFPDKDQLLRGE